METWGFCRECDRWFYCPKWFDKAAPQPVCPVCGAEPRAIENRPPGSIIPNGAAPHGEAGTPPGDRRHRVQRSQAGTIARAATVVESEPRTLIRGLCPKCRRWFACDDWFNHSVPLPCCPRCGLAPTRLQYQTPKGTSVIGIDLETSDLWIG